MPIRDGRIVAWREQLDANKHPRSWSGDEDQIPEIAQAFAAAIKDCKTVDFKSHARRLSRVKTAQGFDRIYGEVCDIADAELIWLGS